MAEFALPKNSKIGKGKTWPKPEGAANLREFHVYRWNPDDGLNPHVDTYFVDTDDCGPMILDAIPYTIIGVAPHGFKGTVSLAAAEQTWIPISMYSQMFGGFAIDAVHDRRFLAAVSFGRLKPGVSMAQAEASLKTIASRLETEYPKENSGRGIALSSLAEAAVGINQHDQFTLAGALMMCAVGLVLLALGGDGKDQVRLAIVQGPDLQTLRLRLLQIGHHRDDEFAVHARRRQNLARGA